MPQFEKSLILADEAATRQFGSRLSKTLIPLEPPYLVFLEGALGVGKTTLVRGFLQGLGHQGIVKSPTYTVVESYEIGQTQVVHFDLYRLSRPEELVAIGISEYFDTKAIVFVEWPSQGKGFLPKADLWIDLKMHGSKRVLNVKGFSERLSIEIEKWI